MRQVLPWGSRMDACQWHYIWHSKLCMMQWTIRNNRSKVHGVWATLRKVLLKRAHCSQYSLALIFAHRGLSAGNTAASRAPPFVRQTATLFE